MKCIEILESKIVKHQRVVHLNHAQFGNSWPFAGAFLLRGDPNDGFPLVDAGRKRVSVACHWERSNDEDDCLHFLVSDSKIHVVENYVGPVVKRIGCTQGCECNMNGRNGVPPCDEVSAALLKKKLTH